MNTRAVKRRQSEVAPFHANEPFVPVGQADRRESLDICWGATLD